MEMTEKYLVYITLLKTRDQVITALFVVAGSLVVAWQLTPMIGLPASWLAWLRRIALVAGLVLYVAMIVTLAYMNVEVLQ